MSISMSPSARYVTQSSLFSNCFTGPLTDRKIERYIKEGKYGELAKLKATAKVKKAKRKLEAKKATRKELFEKLFSGF